jgi:hypothetical protein
LAVPFLSYALETGDEATLNKLASEILSRAPNDVVAAWFIGASEIGNPQTARRGMAKLRFALHNGVDKVVSVPLDLRRAIETADR